MKRILSLLFSLLILLPVFAGAIPAGAAYAFNIDEVEAKYFDVKPYIDGYISEAEWGTPVVYATQDDATTVGGNSPIPNRFFAKLGDSYDEENLTMSYLLWLGWDENYFYIGAKVSDPDGHSNYGNRSDLWNGDALQVRIDPEGANAFCFGDEFYPEDATDHKPWGSYNVSNMTFGYCLNAMGYKEAWNNISNKGMLGNNSYTQSMGIVDMAIGYSGDRYTFDTQNGITTYEIAIPWSYIDASFQQIGHQYYPWSIKVKKNPDGSVKSGPDGAIGYEYGMSAVVYNADGLKKDGANALLTWGSGVADIQQSDENYRTCAGSNAVILSGDKVSEDSLYNANYARYTLGGKVPLIPHNYWDTFIDKNSLVELTYDNAADINTFGASSNGERVKLEDGNWVLKWDKATQKELEEWLPESGLPQPTLNTYNYLSSEGVTASGDYGPAFTFEFDIMVTGLEQWEEGRTPFIGNWFGGTSIDYYCGYDFGDGKFKVLNFRDPTEVLASTSSEFTLGEWHHWVFQYNNADNTLCFYFDPKMEFDGFVAPTAFPIFKVKYKYFDYGSVEDAIMLFRRLNAQIMIDNVRFYNAVDFDNREDPDVQNFTWEWKNDYSGRITITGYNGAKTNINIPYKINGNTVGGISSSAFKGNTDIERIVIPYSVTRIYEDTFAGCTSLQNIYVNADYVTCELFDVDDFKAANCKEYNDSFDFSVDFKEKDDVTKVFTFKPHKNGRYYLSLPDEDFILWIFDENGNLIDRGYKCGIRELGAWGDIYQNIVGERFNVKAGDTYYIVVRGISPSDREAVMSFSLENISAEIGDADGNGSIGTKDVLLIRQYLGSITDEQWVDTNAADINRDGKVNTKDVLMLRKYLGGVIDEL